VDHSAPISARQLAVLQWIADGCPDGVMNGHGYKTTAKSLQGRRLVEAGVRTGTWRAEVTDAGRHYLDHGDYPPGMWANQSGQRVSKVARAQPALRAVSIPPLPAANADPPQTPSPRYSVEELAEDLVVRVMTAGGPIPAGENLAGDAGEQLTAASRHAPSLPFGKRLRLRSENWPGHVRELFLDEDFAVRVAEQPVPVPQRVTRLHPAAVAYREDADRQEVSKDSLSRAIRIIHALATEAERRGHQATTPRTARSQYNSDFVRSLKNGQLAIVIDGFAYSLRIREQQGPGGGARTHNTHSGRNLPRWLAARSTTFLPTGRLQITVQHGYGRDGRPAEFRDTKTRALENRLPAILRELEIRALEDDWRRQEEERKAEEKRQRWEQAMARARDDFRQAALAGELTAQLERFRLVGEIDRYLAGLRSIHRNGEKQTPGASEWMDWIASYRDEIDPLRQPPVMPATPDPSPEDLHPFLNGWDPHGPDSHW
jgi:hypothetical protein